MARGQVQQVFVFILAAFIIGLIVLLGAQMVKKTLDMGNEAKFVSFKNDFQRDVNGMNYLDSKERVYAVPSGLKEVCFVDFAEDASCSGCPSLSGYPLVDAQDSSVNTYFFFGNRIETMNVSGVDVGCCFFRCFKPGSGYLRFGLEGIGRGKVLVEGG